MWNRRVFLKRGGVALLTLGSGGGPAFLRRAAAAVGETGHGERPVLVTLFQRGAMDGLAAVPVIGDGRLRSYRPRLALTAARTGGDDRAIDLDGRFGLHPALRPLHEFWADGSLAVVHGVGSPDPTRSHFDAQDYMETGTPGRKGTRSGWLNRVCGLFGHEATPFRAVSLTQARPRSFYGPERTLSVSNLQDLRLDGGENDAGGAAAGFEALYAKTSQELLHDVGAETFEAVERLGALDLEAYRPARGADYPRSPLGDALRQVAQLVKAQVGLEVAFVESGGWDTHVQQGAANGTFSRRATDLAQSIRAFWRDLGVHRGGVVLMTMTEFGRTVRENGSGGTDHGHGSCLFLLGEKVHGGRVHGEVGELTAGALYEGRDLPVTTDFRQVFMETAQRHLGVQPGTVLFPGWSGERMSLFRS